MHVGKQFSFYAYVKWTKRELTILALLALIPTALHSVFNITVIALPLFIATIMGTTVAFVISFKNNAAYARLSEALKQYADIQSSSNYFGLLVNGLVKPENREKIKPYISQLINQHIAWLTTLRYMLRREKPWENLSEPGNKDFSSYYRIIENEMPLEKALEPYLSQKEISILMTKHNSVIYCLQLQIEILQKIIKAGLGDVKEIQYINQVINNLNISQTNCFRLKNFPYPRNFYSITKYFLFGFLILLPFSLVSELAKIDRVWLTVPVSMLISWMFVCLEKVGQNTTNPFEGGINDVPISNLSRGIEIDLLQMMGQQEIPETIEAKNDILL